MSKKKPAKKTDSAVEAVEKALEIDFGAELESEMSGENFDVQADDLDDALSAIEQAGEASAEEDFDLDLDFDLSDEDIVGKDIDPEFGDISAPAVPAANDDSRRGVSSLIYSMQRRPSRKIFGWVALVSLLWIVGAILAGNWIFGDALLEVRSLEDFRENPGLILLTIAALLPIILFYTIGLLLFRASDMRLAARSMTEAAVRLSEPDEFAKDSILSVSQAIRSEVNVLNDGMQNALTRAGEIKVLVDGEVSTLQRAFTENDERMRGLISGLVGERENVVTHAERVRESITGAHENLSAELNEFNEKINESMRATTENLSVEASVKGAEIGASLGLISENLVSALSDTGNSLLDNIAEKSLLVNSQMDEKNKAFVDSLSTAGETMSQMISTQSNDLLQQTQSVTQTLQDALSLRSSEMLSNISDASERLHGGLDDRLILINEALVGRGDQLVAQMGERTEALSGLLKTSAEQFEDRTGRLHEALETRGEAMSSLLIERTKEISAAYSSGSEQINHLASKTKEELALQTDTLQLLFDQRTQSIVDAAGMAADQLTTSLDQQKADFSETVQATSQSIDELLSSTSQRQIEELNKTADIVKSAVETQTEKVSETLVETARETARALGEANAEIDETLKSGTAAASAALQTHQETLDAKAQAIVSSVQEQTEEISNRLDHGANSISEALALRSGEIATKLGEKVSGITESISEEAARATQSLEKGVTDFANRISASAEDAENAIGARTQSMASLLDEKSAPLISGIDEAASNLADTLETSAAAAAQTVASAHESLSGQVGLLLSRVAQSNEVLKELIDEADSRLNSVQDVISKRSEEMNTLTEQSKENFAEAERKISSHIGSLAQLSTGVLGNLGQISQQFELQSDSLKAAADLVHATENNLALTSDQRKHTIDELTEGLTQRSYDIERQMSAFSELVNATLGDAESRAREIGTMLRQSSEDTSAAMSEELAKLTQAADAESRRAAQVIQAASQGMASELGDAIEGVTKRFTSASDDMRHAAKTVSEELASTRGEIRKNVMDLPEETKENTAALRRAVSDQIRALKELSGIVSQTKDAYAADAAPAPKPVAPQAQQAPLAAPSAPALDFGQPAASPTRPSRAPSPAPIEMPVAAPAPAEPTEQRGWVSDLLARASKEEAPAPRQADLTTITNEIANAIDNAAIDDLWTRYRKGERGLFSRALYTQHGLAVFDQVSQKYAHDANFRAHVDKYVQDFEQALTEIVRNDRDNHQTQATLVSDSGKVYTLLAHASGRMS